jgi:hypothetical protein
MEHTTTYSSLHKTLLDTSIPSTTLFPSISHSLVDTTTMPDLLLPILLLLSTIELAFTAYLSYFILSSIYRIFTAFLVSTWKSIGGIEVVTHSLFGMSVNLRILLVLAVLVGSTVAMMLGYRDGGRRGRGSRIMRFG